MPIFEKCKACGRMIEGSATSKHTCVGDYLKKILKELKKLNKKNGEVIDNGEKT